MVQPRLPHGALQVALDSPHCGKGTLTCCICCRHDKDQTCNEAHLPEESPLAFRQTPQKSEGFLQSDLARLGFPGKICAKDLQLCGKFTLIEVISIEGNNFL